MEEVPLSLAGEPAPRAGRAELPPFFSPPQPIQAEGGGGGFPREGQGAAPFLPRHWSELLWEAGPVLSCRLGRAGRGRGGWLRRKGGRGRLAPPVQARTAPLPSPPAWGLAWRRAPCRSGCPTTGERGRRRRSCRRRRRRGGPRRSVRAHLPLTEGSLGPAALGGQRAEVGGPLLKLVSPSPFRSGLQVLRSGQPHFLSGWHQGHV